MARTRHDEADVAQTGVDDGGQDLDTGGRIDSVHRRRAQRAAGGLLASIVVHWGAGDIVRVGSTDRVGRLEVLVRPHLVDILALVQVLLRPGVT